MSYVIDEKYSKKNFAVYSKNRDDNKEELLMLGGKWRSSLKNGESGWLLPTQTLPNFKQFLEQQTAKTSPVTQLKKNIKNRKNQKVYRRAISEDDEYSKNEEKEEEEQAVDHEEQDQDTAQEVDHEEQDQETDHNHEDEEEEADHEEEEVDHEEADHEEEEADHEDDEEENDNNTDVFDLDSSENESLHLSPQPKNIVKRTLSKNPKLEVPTQVTKRGATQITKGGATQVTKGGRHK